MPYTQVISESVGLADDTFQSTSECEWVKFGVRDVTRGSTIALELSSQNEAWNIKEFLGYSSENIYPYAAGG